MTINILNCEFAAGRYNKILLGLEAYRKVLKEYFYTLKTEAEKKFAREMLQSLKDLRKIKLDCDDTERSIDDKAKAIRDGVISTTDTYINHPVFAPHQGSIRQALQQFLLWIAGELWFKTGAQNTISKGFGIFTTISKPAENSIWPEDIKKAGHCSL